MQHHVTQSHVLSSRSSASMLIAAGVCAPSVALASPLGEVVTGVGSSPVAMFVAGCAAGAVTGGLVAMLVNHNERLEMDDRLQDARSAVLRADAIARQMTVQVNDLRRELVELRRKEAAQQAAGFSQAQPMERTESVAAASAQDATEAMSATEAMGATFAVRQDVAPVVADKSSTADLTPAERLARLAQIDLGEEQPEVTAEFVATEATHSREASAQAETPAAAKKTIAAKSQPVPEVKASAPAASQPQAPSTSAGQGSALAELIDQRVPRLDESLFPDIREPEQDTDDFEAAMRAMEENALHDPMAVGDLDAEGDFVSETREPFDASAYVDYLVREELEINRRGAGKRFSRAHLKVFEGTGDLSAARRALKRPRHMSRITKEA